MLKTVEAGRRAVARSLARCVACASRSLAARAARVAPRPRVGAGRRPERLDRGRFTAVYYPERRDARARRCSTAPSRNDTFPGLPRPRQRVLLAIAPGPATFREWVGPGAPEWGAAIAFPESRRIVMQGATRRRGRRRSARGAPPRARASRAARVPRRPAAALVRRGLRELRGARVDARRRARGQPRARVARHADASTSSTTSSARARRRAQNAYALAYRAVVELAALDTAHGLARFFENWHERAVAGPRGARDLRHDACRVRAAVAAAARAAGTAALALVGDVTLGGARAADRRCSRSMSRGGGATGGAWRRCVAADEAAERAARASALEALLRGDDEPDFGGRTARSRRAILIAP